MSSSWRKKLEKKLDGLADTASKESIQTLANWIAFNRKHAQTIATVLSNALQDLKNNAKRQWLYWQLIHEILVRENENPVKWEKLSELRLVLGEALQPAMKVLGSTMPDQLETFLKEWDDHDVFGAPSLNSQIRRLYQSRKNLTTAGSSNAVKTSVEGTNDSSISSTSKPQESLATPSAQPVEASIVPNEKASSSAMSADQSSPSNKKLEGDLKAQSTSDDNRDDATRPNHESNDGDANSNKQAQQQKNQADMPGKATADFSDKADQKSPSAQKQSSGIKEPIEYDFESKGVPSGSVESRDFLDPCKAITTLQIARDIRTNTAVEISTALANLPNDILTACQDLDSGKLEELDVAMTNEFSIRIPSSLIDLDIDEEASSLNMFQDIVHRQQKAREKLIYLLLRSRCMFGSREAAQEFNEIDSLAKKLRKRKELLSDALELEGLDTTGLGNDVGGDDKSQTKKRDPEEELAPLTWYRPESGEVSESGEGGREGIESNKKQKVV